MSSNDRSPDSPAGWILYAHSGLELARTEQSPSVLFETLAFHAQQAAEKALKAVLIANAVSFPRTRSIRVLLNLVPSEITIPDNVLDAVILTEHAVSSRYPGAWEPLGEEDLAGAVRLAQAVVRWAEGEIEGPAMEDATARSERQRHTDLDTSQESPGSLGDPTFPSGSIQP